jgi:hypothetical protein
VWRIAALENSDPSLPLPHCSSLGRSCNRLEQVGAFHGLFKKVDTDGSSSITIMMGFWVTSLGVGLQQVVPGRREIRSATANAATAFRHSPPDQLRPIVRPGKGIVMNVHPG